MKITIHYLLQNTTPLILYNIEESEGATYSEKAKNYLMSKVDISAQTIDRIIDILTD